MSSKDTHDGDVTFIRALAELLKDNDLAEIEVKREYGDNDRLNVRVSKSGPPAAFASPAAFAPPGGYAAPTSYAVPPAAPSPVPSPQLAASGDPASHPGVVTSPMVGTVYLQAEPGSPAFVSVGSQVKSGDTLLIIEAMKTMNQIPATHAGTVRRILVEDGAPVEYGAPLMIIE
jgi:acetyl-CoA carboxylase biotin carboxyl carrier protein